jgi:hypothetical protein
VSLIAGGARDAHAGRRDHGPDPVVPIPLRRSRWRPGEESSSDGGKELPLKSGS